MQEACRLRLEDHLGKDFAGMVSGNPSKLLPWRKIPVTVKNAAVTAVKQLFRSDSTVTAEGIEKQMRR